MKNLICGQFFGVGGAKKSKFTRILPNYRILCFYRTNTILVRIDTYCLWTFLWYRLGCLIPSICTLQAQKKFRFFENFGNFAIFQKSKKISMPFGCTSQNVSFRKNARSIYLSHSKLLFVCILYKTSYLLENKDKTNMSKNVKF